jgi:thiosulfate/3-mercaptopyruvate sulfurtransferase
MSLKPLIEADQLAAALRGKRCVVVDCSFDLQAPHAGFSRYLDGHIPGARYAHLDRDLAAPPTASSGRHPLPDPAALVACLGAWGIDASTAVVVYDDAGGAVAARLWWLLRWLGHEDVSVLNGGLKAWRDQGSELETRVPQWDAKEYRPRITEGGGVVASEQIANELGNGAVLLDARARPRFRGEVEPIDPVAGHVPGALNLPFSDLIDESGRLHSPDRLAEVFAAAVGSGSKNTKVIAMCGSGVTACHLLLGLAVAEWPPGRLYAGSWSEWIRDPERPVATDL